MKAKEYEAHVTVDFRGQPSHLKAFIKSRDWHHSAIDSDPLLGEGVKHYATTHYPIRTSREKVEEACLEMAAQLKRAGYKVLRAKVELVLFDRRFS